MSAQNADRTRERRENLLAGLNDGPSGMAGWDFAEEPAIRLRDGVLLERARWRRLDGMWWSLKGGAYARRVREEPAERYFALTGRRLEEKVREAEAEAARRVEPALRRFLSALQSIGEAVERAAAAATFPKVPFADPTQADLTKGA